MMPILSFDWLWKCYKFSISCKTDNGFGHYWSLPLFQRINYATMNCCNGWFSFHAESISMLPARVAICVNYIHAIMEELYDPDRQEDDQLTGCFAEFFKVEELKKYLQEDWASFLEAMEASKINIVWSEDEQKIGFYYERI